jgi:predicted TIM-barrel fold metal-dependent hydrolase
LSVVDAHHHLWSLEEVPHDWLSRPPDGPSMLGDFAAIRRTYDVDDYRADMVDVELLASVHVESAADDPLEETRWLARRIAETACPTVLVVGCRLEQPNARDVLREHLALSERVRGVRQMLNWHELPHLRSAPRGDLLTDPEWRRGLSVLAELGLSFDLQVFPHQLSDAAAVARAFSEVGFVLNHGGTLSTGTPDDRKQRLEGLKRLSDEPNVAVKISGFGINNELRSADALLEWFMTLVELFGAERAMLGSDYPVDKLHSEANPLIGLLELSEELSPADAFQLQIATAARVYRLDDVANDWRQTA